MGIAPNVPSRIRPQSRGHVDLLGMRAAGMTNPAAIMAMVTVFLAPMNYLRLGQIYITLSDMSAFLCLVLAWMAGTSTIRPFGPATPLWFLSFLLLAAGLMIGSVVNGNPYALAVILTQYGYSLILMPFVVGGRNYAQSLVLMRVLILSVVAVMAVGIYAVHFWPDAPSALVSPSGRMRSLVERSNEAAVLGGIGLVLTISLLLLHKMRRETGLIIMAICLYGIVLTGSNTGTIIALFGVITMTLLSGSGRIVGGMAALIGIAFIAVMLGGESVLPRVFVTRVLDPLISGNINQLGTLQGRVDLLQEAWDLARHTVFVGLGAEQMRHVSSHGAPVHNSYLLFLVEGGILSLAGLVGLLLTGLYTAWLASRIKGRWIIAITTAIIVAIQAITLTMLPHFYARFLTIPMIVVMCLAVAAWQEPARSNPHER